MYTYFTELHPCSVSFFSFLFIFIYFFILVCDSGDRVDKLQITAVGLAVQSYLYARAVSFHLLLSVFLKECDWRLFLGKRKQDRYEDYSVWFNMYL